MLEISNGQVGANCVVVTGSNGIPVPVDKVVGYVNLLLHKNGTVAIKNGTGFLVQRLPLFGGTAVHY